MTYRLSFHWPLAFTFLLGSSAAAAVEPVKATPAKPNMVIFLADDLGWGDVGWHGSEVKTPQLDRLAADGAKLEQFYVQPVCSPTRAALLTGRYPMRYGLQVDVVRPWARYGLPLEERTLAQALKDAGYVTAICGKWHLGHFDPAYLPTRRGFDHQYGHYNGALDYFTHVRDGGFDWHRDDKVCRDEGYSTHSLAGEAIRLIGAHEPAKPLFLYVPFNAVHTPFQVPQKYTAPYAKLPKLRRQYAGMIAALDEAVGQVVAALDKKGMRKNTLIIFASDNGGYQPGKIASNGPLRAGKTTLYEGGVRVPALAAWEGQIKAGTVVNEPLHIVDWYPTLINLAGGSVKQRLPLDGRDAWATLVAGHPSPHREILLNATPYTGAIRVGDWKLVLNGHVVRPSAVLEDLRLELFNLAKDPYEKENLADKMPDKVKDLRSRYETLAKEAVPPKQLEEGPAGPPKGFRAPKVWGEKE